VSVEEADGVVNRMKIAPLYGERPPSVDCSVESMGNAVEESQWNDSLSLSHGNAHTHGVWNPRRRNPHLR